MFLILVLYTICASMFTISKAALAYTQPIFYIAVRMVLAGILLGAYYLIKVTFFKENFRFSWRDGFLLAQIVIFHIYLTYICDICALKDLTSIESAFIYNLSPFISAIFSYFFFGEVMTNRKWLGLAIGFSSLLPDIWSHSFAQEVSLQLIPKFVTLIAVISSAYGWIVMRKLVKDRGYSPIFVNSFGMFIGGILAFGTSWFFEPWSPSPVTDWYAFIKLTLLIVVVANIVFYNLYGYLLSRYTATLLSFAGFLCPLITALLGWLFLGETLSWNILISLTIVSMGLYIFYKEELKQGYIG